MWEKTTVVVVFVFIFYCKENILQYCTGIESYQHVGTQLKKATTFSRSLTPTGREIQPPDLVYRHPLKGSSYPLI